ncbi:Arginine--tRNA ligase [Candidatus Erwinia haradaeae]|uniref:Arginine--tRNA ligase n=1 Tax=Candidatus Erwinia haradaeae TaxID=1922217 RepID=A0A451D062_9GAMM|nr:arginine--tRNA ligase [Candidatus Erwinia haradaeae]VFP78675.1 Arginine--tRNA ligase [Candidatus Erwinia haradaeae]
MNIQNLIRCKVSSAMISAGASIHYDPQVRRSARIEFGNYQVNGIMTLAKNLKISPRQLAKKVLDQLNLDDLTKKVEIAGPGFINIFLDPKWLSVQIDNVLKQENLGITPINKQVIVIDYSSPNVAKEMHVGHLRSTIIGDAMARTLEFLGHKVIRANHIGDWGTQFGMLIAFLEEKYNKNCKNITLTDLDIFYRNARQHYDNNLEFAERSRQYVVKLQDGDQYCRRIWKQLVNITMQENQIIYDRMNVTLTHQDIMGESMYHHMMSDIVSDLKTKGLARQNQGAIVVFLEKYKNNANEIPGVIIQKKDGGYLYTTTDIACAKYRYETLKANRILYYTDSRQNQHLLQAWDIARQAGYIPESLQLEHHMFGMMLGRDGKPFKTRRGNTIKLSYLLDEAIHRATKLILDKNPDLPKDKLQELARIIGIGGLKYADLSKNRTTNYVFDWDHMLSLTGNTALYIQYALTRILSIFRKAQINQEELLTATTNIVNNCEVALAVCLLQFNEIIIEVAQDGMPHLMCSYLYRLAGLFSNFYEECPILYAKNKKIQQSHLRLALLTETTLKQGLNLLGIDTIESM